MAQDYKLTSFEASDFQDNYGNFWCNAAFEGVSEPVRWVVKDPTRIQIGQTYYGEIKDATGRSGKPYLRFHKQNKEDAPQPLQSAAPVKKDWQPKDDSHIRAQWAIGQAVSAHVGMNTDGKLDYKSVESMASEFYKMVDRVKGGSDALAGGETFNLDDIPY